MKRQWWEWLYIRIIVTTTTMTDVAVIVVIAMRHMMLIRIANRGGQYAILIVMNRR